MKITAIIQARCGSTRLPNKIFKTLSGKPVLWHVVNRVSQSNLISKIVIATTTLPEDNAVEKFCLDNNVSFYRGSSEDVLSRYYEAAKNFDADIIIRITSDCPVIDPRILDSLIEDFLEENLKTKLDYLSNTLVRTFPRGLDAEVFTIDALEKSFLNAVKNYEREHVTPYIYQHPEYFALKNYLNDRDYSQHRWTLDTEEDYSLLKKIYDSLYAEGKIFLFDDVIKLFEKNPDLININKDIEQKKLNT